MFAYLYYRIYATYKHKWKDSVPGVYAVCILSLLQGLNILSVIYVFEILNKQDLGIKKIYYGLLMAALIALNYYRFNFLTRFSELEKKWVDESKQMKTSRGILVMIYIFLSVFLTLFLADYLSENN
ncbi:MAG: hypothetical protein Q8T08_15490 [Ignavibacteria bacterium]|nr:hypothetical protein [Ignavibacteria bacterium]